MSEYELPERATGEVEAVRRLMGASTPHFALQLRNRIRNLIGELDPTDPARVLGESELERLETIAFEGEHRGGAQTGERELPSIRDARPVPEAGDAAPEDR